MKKTALVIMAAGVGSRFGNGIKQLAPVGPNGEIIMDYYIRDALEAGFNKIAVSYTHLDVYKRQFVSFNEGNPLTKATACFSIRSE